MTTTLTPIAGLLATAVPHMTLRELLECSFNDNWDNRRVVAQDTDEDAVFRGSILFSFEVPMALAKQVLVEMGPG